MRMNRQAVHSPDTRPEADRLVEVRECLAFLAAVEDGEPLPPEAVKRLHKLAFMGRNQRDPQAPSSHRPSGGLWSTGNPSELPSSEDFCIIGRDVLSYCEFVYNGTTGKLSLRNLQA